MVSKTTRSFRDGLAALPADVRRAAKEAYARFRVDPHYPGLHFARVHPVRPVYSARIGIHYRAVGVLDGDEVVWYWVGHHTEYDHLRTRL